MTITPEQLKALQLAHDAVRHNAGVTRAAIRDYLPDTLPDGEQNMPKVWILAVQDESFDLLDTLTAAIENLKEGTK